MAVFSRYMWERNEENIKNPSECAHEARAKGRAAERCDGRKLKIRGKNYSRRIFKFIEKGLWGWVGHRKKGYLGGIFVTLCRIIKSSVCRKKLELFYVLKLDKVLGVFKTLNFLKFCQFLARIQLVQFWQLLQFMKLLRLVLIQKFGFMKILGKFWG